VETQEPTDFVVNAEVVCGEIRRTEAQCFMGLPFDRAMSCFDFAAVGPEFIRRNRPAPRPIRREAGLLEETLIGLEQTPCFAATRLTLSGTAPDEDRGRAYVGIVAGGRGVLSYDGGEIPLRPASTLFVPAASRPASYRAQTGEPLTLVKCFPPAP
jgi:mannose-6-phosphate isomerase